MLCRKVGDGLIDIAVFQRVHDGRIYVCYRGLFQNERVNLWRIARTAEMNPAREACRFVRVLREIDWPGLLWIISLPAAVEPDIACVGKGQCGLLRGHFRKRCREMFVIRRRQFVILERLRWRSSFVCDVEGALHNLEDCLARGQTLSRRSILAYLGIFPNIIAVR